MPPFSNQKKRENRLINIFAAALALQCTATTPTAGAEPVITVDHAYLLQRDGGIPMGYERFRQVDCANLIKFEGKYWVTEKFTQQVDANNQNPIRLNYRGKPLPEDPAQKRKMLSDIAYDSIVHFGRAHHICELPAGKADYLSQIANGKSKREALEFVENLYGGDWSDMKGPNNQCPLTDAIRQCMAAMK